MQLKFIKKQSISFYIGIWSCCLALAGMIMFLVAMETSKYNFKTQFTVGIIALVAISVVIMVVALCILPQLNLKENMFKLLRSVMLIIACANLGGAAGLIVNAVAVEFAYTFFSSLYIGTPKADFMPSACYEAIIAIFLVIASILSTCFLGIFNKTKLSK